MKAVTRRSRPPLGDFRPQAGPRGRAKKSPAESKANRNSWCQTLPQSPARPFCAMRAGEAKNGG